MITLAVTASLILVIVVGLSFFYSPVLKRPEHSIVLPSMTDRDDVPSAGNIQDVAVEPASPVEVTGANVQNIIRSLKRPEAYYAEFKMSLFYPSGESRSRRAVWQMDGCTAIEHRTESGDPLKHMVIGKGKLSVWDHGSLILYSGLAGSASSDQEAGIPTYGDVALIDKSEIIDAGYEEYNSARCVYVEAKKGSYTEKYIVSLDNGLLVKFENRLNGSVAWSAEMDVFGPESPGRDAFSLPDGKNIFD